VLSCEENSLLDAGSRVKQKVICYLEIQEQRVSMDERLKPSNQSSNINHALIHGVGVILM
jgi:hypothetical protein